MKCSILLVTILLGLVAALASEPPQKVDWSKIKPIDVIPGKYDQWKTKPGTLARGAGGRIIGGVEVKPGAFPHQAGLRINGQSFCGGSLISNLYVITAAHCTIG